MDSTESAIERLATARPVPARSDDDPANKRTMQRHYLIYYLRVFDRSNGEILGHLVDITTKGVMILRESPVPANKPYSLRLRWRNAEGRLQVVDFEGICRWCRPDVNPDFYAAGFAIDAAKAEDVETIRKLIEELGLPN